MWSSSEPAVRLPYSCHRHRRLADWPNCHSVLGLSIAQELLHVGLKIAIVARDLPEDLHSTAFASPWAGANWASYATNEDERRRDTITFERFAKLSERYPDLVQKMPFVYVWNEEGSYEEQWYKDLVYNVSVE